jgi:hypothetical protein
MAALELIGFVASFLATKPSDGKAVHLTDLCTPSMGMN